MNEHYPCTTHFRSLYQQYLGLPSKNDPISCQSAQLLLILYFFLFSELVTYMIKNRWGNIVRLRNQRLNEINLNKPHNKPWKESTFLVGTNLLCCVLLGLLSKYPILCRIDTKRMPHIFTIVMVNFNLSPNRSIFHTIWKYFSANTSLPCFPLQLLYLQCHF